MHLLIQHKEDLIALLEERRGEIKSFGVKRLGLFGSFARGEQRMDSDIDLLVEFESAQKTYDNFIHLSFFLEDLLQRPVEIVTAESLSPYIRPHVLGTVEYA
ncbi:MAG: nucleotidyltransferase family protein, partial [Chloroflexi bacterium]|nr:nucleotidyltransferase family protein [Chloroflexota bacterium]